MSVATFSLHLAPELKAAARPAIAALRLGAKSSFFMTIATTRGAFLLAKAGVALLPIGSGAMGLAAAALRPRAFGLGSR